MTEQELEWAKSNDDAEVTIEFLDGTLHKIKLVDSLDFINVNRDKIKVKKFIPRRPMLSEKNKPKPKKWFDKNEKLNADYTIQVGDRLYVSGSNDIWIVVEMIEGYNIEDHGSILLRKEDVNYSSHIPLGEPDNNTYLHPVYFGWQRFCRIIHPTCEQVMAGVLSTAPYKNWQEWLDTEEGKKVFNEH